MHLNSLGRNFLGFGIVKLLSGELDVSQQKFKSLSGGKVVANPCLLVRRHARCDAINAGSRDEFVLFVSCDLLKMCSAYFGPELRDWVEFQSKMSMISCVRIAPTIVHQAMIRDRSIKR